jgi:hypothetical protein
MIYFLAVLPGVNLGDKICAEFSSEKKRTNKYVKTERKLNKKTEGGKERIEVTNKK